MTFSGFPSSGLDLLARLPNLSRQEFRDAGDTYRSGLFEPSKQFVIALGPRLREVESAGITFGARTNESIAPINNDRRFNPGIAPYKDHLLFRFWEGPDRQRGSTLFVRITPNELGFGVGTNLVSDQIDRFRASVDADGARLAGAIGWLVRYRGAEVVGSNLKRVPAPYGPDHPHADLLRHKRLHVRWSIEPAGVLESKRLVTTCRDQLARAGDVHRWIVQHLS